MKLSGRITRSTDEWEMSRSCHSAMFSNAAWQLARTSARQADDLLAANRVALVRHRRGALLALGERLLDLADLGLLQAANRQRELLERGRRDRQRGHELRVPIALNHLRRHRIGLEPEPAADVGFDLRWQVRKGADRAGDLADADRRARAAHAFDVPIELRVPERELQAERHRLGVDAVRPADHRRRTMLDRPIANGLGQRREIAQNHVARLAHLQRLRRVDDVRRGHAEVKPARRRADLLGHGGGEGNHVVLGRLLDLFDARDVEGAALADVARRLRRNDAGGGHRLGGGGLDEQPGLVPALVAPDAPHLGVGVSWDHAIEKSLPPRTPMTNGGTRFDRFPCASVLEHQISRVLRGRACQSRSSRSRGTCRPFTLPRTVADSDPFRNRSAATRCTSAAVTRSMPCSVSSRPNWRSK